MDIASPFETYVGNVWNILIEKPHEKSLLVRSVICNTILKLVTDENVTIQLQKPPSLEALWF